MRYYAHSLPDRPPEQWQPLEVHLQNVATLAAKFASPFGGEQWAHLAGLWHDVGKYADAFQAKLYRENGMECHLETRPEPGRVIHSEAGGHLASIKGWQRGVDRVLAWLIMGHHAGLTDYNPEHIGQRALEPKMREPARSMDILRKIPEWITNQPIPPPPAILRAKGDPAFFIRMLFSCLVDADFLDTEAFMDRSRSRLRRKEYPAIKDLLTSFDDYMDALCAGAAKTAINAIRAKILSRCRDAATDRPAVFSLSVPTGGGKTLASLAFALRHAVTYRRERIIYVIPYTSIIEQTADVFRKIPGFAAAVVEHHSNLAETDESRETIRNRLAAENWDAPIIVTTSVQFFESLFACRTSRCRKLHNIANSVVIFDEAQCLPPDFLRPAVFAIRELHRHYRVTPLLCTATQPVLTRREDSLDFRFSEGFERVVEIIANPEELARRLRRVEVSLLGNSLQPVELPELALSLQAEQRPVLCIVNRKDKARELARLLPEEQTVHLSTNMCASHRTDVLEGVRERLQRDPEPFIVISTSLIEAGVDIDFPLVYRELAGLDSIAQAAGRCNREGRLTEGGRPVPGTTRVFALADPPAYVRQAAGITAEILNGSTGENLLSPANYERYFRQFFWQRGHDALDAKQILALFSSPMNYYFRTAAQRFRFIADDWQEPVLTPYGEAASLLGRLATEPWRQRQTLRQLGRFSINVPCRLFTALVEREYIRRTEYPGLFMLDPVLYDRRYGFIPPAEADTIDPDLFIA